MFSVVPFEREHVTAVAARLLARDIAACRSIGAEPEQALRAVVDRSPLVWTAANDGVPVCIFGAEPHAREGFGRPWMWVTSDLPACSTGFLLANSEYLDKMLAEFPCLMDVVDCRNAVSIRWLRWNGFAMRDPFEWEGERYMIFEKAA